MGVFDDILGETTETPSKPKGVFDDILGEAESTAPEQISVTTPAATPKQDLSSLVPKMVTERSFTTNTPIQKANTPLAPMSETPPASIDLNAVTSETPSKPKGVFDDILGEAESNVPVSGDSAQQYIANEMSPTRFDDILADNRNKVSSLNRIGQSPETIASSQNLPSSATPQIDISSLVPRMTSAPTSTPTKSYMAPESLKRASDILNPGKPVAQPTQVVFPEAKSIMEPQPTPQINIEPPKPVSVPSSNPPVIEKPVIIPDAEEQALNKKSPEIGNKRVGLIEQTKKDLAAGLMDVGAIGLAATGIASEAVGQATKNVAPKISEKSTETATKLLDKYLSIMNASEEMYPSDIPTYKDIQNPSDAFKYMVSGMVRNAPMFLPTLGSGAIVSEITTPIIESAAKKLSQEMIQKYGAEKAAEMVAKKIAFGQTASAIAGAYPVSTALEAGSIAGDIYRDTGEKKPLTTLAGASVAGALDIIEPIMALKKALGPVAAEEFTGTILRRLGKEGAKQYLTGGGTEAAQTLVEEVTKAKAENKPLDINSTIDGMIDSWLQAAPMGLATGIASQGSAELNRIAAERSQKEPTTTQPTETIPKTEPTSVAPPPAQGSPQEPPAPPPPAPATESTKQPPLAPTGTQKGSLEDIGLYEPRDFWDAPIEDRQRMADKLDLASILAINSVKPAEEAAIPLPITKKTEETAPKAQESPQKPVIEPKTLQNEQKVADSVLKTPVSEPTLAKSATVEPIAAPAIENKPTETAPNKPELTQVPVTTETPAPTIEPSKTSENAPQVDENIEAVKKYRDQVVEQMASETAYDMTPSQLADRLSTAESILETLPEDTRVRQMAIKYQKELSRRNLDKSGNPKKERKLTSVQADEQYINEEARNRMDVENKRYGLLQKAYLSVISANPGSVLALRNGFVTANAGENVSDAQKSANRKMHIAKVFDLSPAEVAKMDRDHNVYSANRRSIDDIADTFFDDESSRESKTERLLNLAEEYQAYRKPTLSEIKDRVRYEYEKNNNHSEEEMRRVYDEQAKENLDNLPFTRRSSGAAQPSKTTTGHDSVAYNNMSSEDKAALNNIEDYAKVITGEESQHIRVVPHNQKSKKIIDSIKKVFPNLRVVSYEASDSFDKETSSEGVYHRGTVFLNDKGVNPAIFTIGHEITHRLFALHPELKRFFENYIKDRITETGNKLYTRIYETEKKARPGTSEARLEEIAREEVMADLAGQLWSDPEFLKELQNQSKPLFKRVTRDIVRILTDLINSLKGVKEAESVVRDLEGVRRAYAKIVLEASKREGGNVESIIDSATPLFSKIRNPEDVYNEIKATQEKLNKDVGGIVTPSGHTSFSNKRKLENKISSLRQEMNQGIENLKKENGINNPLFSRSELVKKIGGKVEYMEIPSIPTKEGEPVDNQQGIAITPEMKDKIASGLPLFSREQLDKVYSDAVADKLTARKRLFNKDKIEKENRSNFFVNALVPISTRIKNISERALYDIVRKFEYAYGQGIYNDTKRVVPYLEKFDKLSPEDRIVLDLALKNRDVEKINEIHSRNNMTKEYDEVRKLLDEIINRMNDADFDVNYLRDYFPRKVLNAEGLLEAVGSGPLKGAVDMAIEKQEKQLGRPLTTTEKASIANHTIGILGKAIQSASNTKERTITSIDKDIDKYYANSPDALLGYIENMNKAYYTRQIYGRAVKERTGKNQLNLTGIPKESNNPNINNIESSIGALVLDLVEKGKLNAKDQDELIGMLKARLNYAPTTGVIKTLKDLSYLTAMGSGFSSFVSQLQDLTWAFYVAPKQAPKAFLQALGHSINKKIAPNILTKEDLGIDRIAEEFRDTGKLTKALKHIFDLTQLTRMDSVGKDTLINASLRRMQSQAKNNDTTLRKEIERVFGDKAESVMEDLKNGIESDNVKYLLFNRLLDFQPVALSEMPLSYLENPNGRILYTLKSFTIKQMDVFRRELLSNIKNAKIPEERTIAVRNAIALMALFVLSGASSDEIKDFIFGRTTSLSDKIIDNILRIMGVSRFTAWRARDAIAKNQPGFIGEAALRLVAPPLNIIEDPLMDIGDAIQAATTKPGERTKEFKVKNLESIKDIPVVGKHFYWWMGAGREKELKQREKNSDFNMISKALNKANREYKILRKTDPTAAREYMNEHKEELNAYRASSKSTVSGIPSLRQTIVDLRKRKNESMAKGDGKWTPEDEQRLKEKTDLYIQKYKQSTE